MKCLNTTGYAHSSRTATLHIKDEKLEQQHYSFLTKLSRIWQHLPKHSGEAPMLGMFQQLQDCGTWPKSAGREILIEPEGGLGPQDAIQ